MKTLKGSTLIVALLLSWDQTHALEYDTTTPEYGTSSSYEYDVVDSAISHSGSNPALRVDVIGAYELHNEEQCRRLCWYRKLCTSFSFREAHKGDGASACLLHSNHVEGADSFHGTASQPNRREYQATPAPSLRPNGCSERPCGPRETCLPSGAGGGHHCLVNPAVCPAPGPDVTGADAGLQDDVISAECQPFHVVTPRSGSRRMTCQVNAMWTTPTTDCAQAEIFQAVSPQVFPLPWVVEPGWGMCLRGNYRDLERTGIKFTPSREEPSLNINFVFEMRYGNMVSTDTGLVWDTRADGQWGGTRFISNTFPLELGQNFTLSLKLVDQGLELDLRGHESSTIPTAAANGGGGGPDVVDMSGAKYLHVRGEMDLYYINLLSECPGDG